MTTVIGLIVIAFAALAQAAVLPSFSIFGAHPNLVLVLLVAWLIVRPRREGLLLVPAAGLFLGLLDGEPLGLAMLALAPLMLMAELRDMRLVQSDLVPAVVVAAAGTVVYEGIVLVTLGVTGERLDWLASVLDVLVPAAIANALLLLPIYGLTRLASMDLRTRRPAF